MKNRLFKFLALTFSILGITLCSSFQTVSGNYVSANSQTPTASQTVEYKTFAEMPNPLVAGSTPKSYYDDNVLYYVHTADTVGYNTNHAENGFEFNLKFTAINPGAWLSLTLKASGCDRTQSPNLSQKGYSFLIFNHGLVQLLKNGAVLSTGNISAVVLNQKYNIKVAAVNSNFGVNVSLLVDSNSVVDYVDTSSAFYDGNWFNICSDGGVTAELYSTKKEFVPVFETNTLSTIGQDVLTANGANVDIYNNVELIGSAGTVGFYQYCKNFSFEFNANFSTFTANHNFWISWRTSAFDRANQPSNTRGYAARVCQNGIVELYKNQSLVTTGFYQPMLENTNYVIEIGAIDINSNKTNVFININNNKIATFADESQPVQNLGLICMNNDGVVSCKLTSINSKITPIQHSLTKTENQTVVDIYFYNLISFENLTYQDFSNRMLQSIMINDYSIYDLNSLCHTAAGGRAVDLIYTENKLQIIVNNNVLNTANQNITLQVEKVELKKTSNDSGFETSTGCVLNQNYLFLF